MSGLLRRLTNRARTSAAPAVHSVARLPYIAPLELKEAETVSAVEDTVVLPPPERTPRARTTPVKRAPSPVAERNDVSHHRTAGTQRSIDADEPSPDAIPAGRKPIPARENVEIDVPLRLDRLPKEITPRRRPFAGCRLLIPPPSSLASEPRSIHAMSTSRGTRIRAYSPVEDREPTEVRVHIGRIEVTAVHEPAPAKRGRKPERKPMTLDEYLDRRRRRSP